MYISHTKTIATLKQDIREEISAGLVVVKWWEMEVSCSIVQQYVQMDGSHHSDMIFKVLVYCVCA
jgi:hypothetical protein